jgi:hypothetical protein
MNGTGSESRQNRNIYLFSETSWPALGQAQRRGVFFQQGKKWPGREFHHSPTPSAEIKTEWSYTSTLPIRLHRVPRDTFTFTTDNFTGYIIVSWTYTKTAFIDSCKDPVSCSDCTPLKSTMLDAQLFLRLQPVPHREHRRSSCCMCLISTEVGVTFLI